MPMTPLFSQILWHKDSEKISRINKFLKWHFKILSLLTLNSKGQFVSKFPDLTSKLKVCWKINLKLQLNYNFQYFSSLAMLIWASKRCNCLRFNKSPLIFYNCEVTPRCYKQVKVISTDKIVVLLLLFLIQK